MGNVDKEALKRSMKQKKKALEGEIVLKANVCPLTEKECEGTCEHDVCENV